MLAISVDHNDSGFLAPSELTVRDLSNIEVARFDLSGGIV
jgi:hypothetical protein